MAVTDKAAVWPAEDRLAPEIAAATQSQALRELLAASQAVVQNQDNREHDLLDSDDYYQFEGGLTATIKNLSGSLPAIYHNDHSRPDHPVIRSLSEELSASSAPASPIRAGWTACGGTAIKAHPRWPPAWIIWPPSKP